MACTREAAFIAQDRPPAAYRRLVSLPVIADGKRAGSRQQHNAVGGAQRAEIRIGRIAQQLNLKRQGQRQALRKPGNKQLAQRDPAQVSAGCRLGDRRLPRANAERVRPGGAPYAQHMPGCICQAGFGLGAAPIDGENQSLLLGQSIRSLLYLDISTWKVYRSLR